MAANRIPDEIISEILSPALRVSDTTFSTLNSVAGASPFLTFSESSSAYLEVSKSWLRVGTPLLYNVVSIRSTAQAQALAATFTTNPDLGQFIKKLRVEGGYGTFMLTIIQAAPKITDIYLTLLLEKSDNASGLCQALPLLNPVRLILDGHGLFRPSTSAKELYQTLEDCIIHWGKLTRVEAQLNMAHDFSKVLSLILHLDTLVIWLKDYPSWHWLPGYVREISENPNLKRVILSLEPQRSYDSIKSQQLLYDEYKGNPRMTALLNLPDERPSFGNPHLECTEMDISHSSFAYPARLAADATHEEAIWSRVLFFTSRDDVPELNPEGGHSFGFGYHDRPPSRVDPLLVCKMFARLGLPHLYTIVVIASAARARSLVSQLERHPELALHIRALCLDLYDVNDVFDQLVLHMPALVELQAKYRGWGSKISWKAFKDLAETSGAHLRFLRGLQVKGSIEVVSPAALFLFSQIVSLDWDPDVKFDITQELIPRATFNTLTKLTVDKFDGSFFDVLACMELPFLETIFFNSLDSVCDGAAFFQRHGSKLRELKLSERQLNAPNVEIWRNCPMLATLRIFCDHEHFVRDSCLTTSAILPRLEEIFFEILNEYEKLTTKEQIPHFNRLINALRTTNSFPALREVYHPLCKWPTTEHGKDTWSKWAEKLLTRDVHLVGPDGVRWRPRMQPPKQPRRGRNVGLSKSK
ncbi:hypothetical protein R3P38DRAFT_3063842 [Favolaschia claudopus]|uniref:F-box domain-containing protein n=1 Tax=Favolaschia claudopus TaxID=2862362 RepID=A0AAW0A252_9AGAR